MFGTEKRSNLAKGSISPGPGNYVHKSVCFDIEKPKFHVGEKLKDLKPSVKTPGAGTYDPSHTFSKRNLPSYSMK